MELLTKEQHIQHLQFLQEMLHAKISESRANWDKLRATPLNDPSDYIIYHNKINGAKKHHEKLLAELRYLVYLEMNLESLVMLEQGE